MLQSSSLLDTMAERSLELGERFVIDRMELNDVCRELKGNGNLGMKKRRRRKAVPEE